MHLVVNGWFWGRMDTGSGQYLHGLARWLRGQAVEQGRGQGSDEGGRQGAGYGSTEEMK